MWTGVIHHILDFEVVAPWSDNRKGKIGTYSNSLSRIDTQSKCRDILASRYSRKSEIIKSAMAMSEGFSGLSPINKQI